jgi:hypothetical protein
MHCWRFFSRILAGFSVIAWISLINSTGATGEVQAEPPVHAAPVKAIADCLANGEEAVLTKAAVRCMPILKGVPFLGEFTKDNDTPFREGLDAICGDPADQRRLTSDTITKLKDKPIASTGMRIIGGVFCEQFRLVGVELPYSLVLDRSVFRKGIVVRNFHTRADFSIDDSVVFDIFWFGRSKVDGAVFATSAFIEDLHVIESEVQKSFLLRSSILFNVVQFDTLKVGGELSVRGAAMSRMLVQFSQVGGLLDLTGSAVRCGYQLRTSEIGSLMAADIRLGTLEVAAGRYGWTTTTSDHATMLALSEIERRVGNAESCAANARFRPELLLLENQVRSSLCLRAFRWATAERDTELPHSYLTIHDTNIGGSLVVDLSPSEPVDPKVGQLHHFEMVGVTSKNLIFEFKNGAQSYKADVDGLQFNNIRAGHIACEYDPASAAQGAEFVSQARSDLSAPPVDDVIAWLNANRRPATYQFSAFIDAYQRAGDESSAKKLRIERATNELSADFRRWSFRWSSDRSPVADASAGSAFTDWVTDVSDFVWNGVVLGFRWVLWKVADHGYRPQQVLWVLVLVVVGACAYFWMLLRVIGFRSKGNARIKPVGLLFVFDRLIPAYKIADDNYAIDVFYRHAPARRRSRLSVRYLGRDWPVVKGDERDKRRAETMLILLKIVGVVLAVFFGATINALVSK